MHPIERLRYVARSSGAPQEVLVRETAGALAALGFDAAGLVTACRRILDRHPVSGPLWWLCARVLTSNDPNNEAWNAADDVQTAIFYSLGRKGFMPPRREATRLWAARAAARVAALAVLVRPLLTCSDFVTLYQPFASLVPAGAGG